MGVVVRGGALAEIMERDMHPAAVWNRTGTIPIAFGLHAVDVAGPRTLIRVISARDMQRGSETMRPY
jgi:hypothetical protein